jgi:hypothetical protein
VRDDLAEQRLPGLGIVGLLDPAGEVEVIPADDAVLDEAVAGLGDLLLFLFGLGKLAGIADSHGSGEAVGQFDLVELALDGLAQVEIIDIAQDEQRLDDLPEGLERLVECVLAGIGIEPPEDVGGGVLLELDGGDEAQQVIPVVADQRVVDVSGRGNGPALALGAVMTTEEVETLLSDALDGV